MARCDPPWVELLEGGGARWLDSGPGVSAGGAGPRGSEVTGVLSGVELRGEEEGKKEEGRRPVGPNGQRERREHAVRETGKARLTRGPGLSARRGQRVRGAARGGGELDRWAERGTFGPVRGGG
jgi:hypothetical protein